MQRRSTTPRTTTLNPERNARSIVRRSVAGPITALAMCVFAGLAVAPSTAVAREGASLVAPANAARGELPITEVALYRSGVASFTREATVRGDSTLRLDVGEKDINDLLKSLVVVDLDGGRVASVGYSAEEPVQKRLESLGLTDIAQLTMDHLLTAFAGVEANLTTSEGQILGRVLGVDLRSAPSDGGPITEHWVSVLTSGGVRAVLVRDVRSFQLLDPAIQEEMDQLVSVIGSQRTDRLRPVEIELRGEGERRIAAAYVAESPVWKTSYRMLLPEVGDDSGHLQGWAIVENTTDEDWDNVQLSLVSGRPIAFTMGLSSPFYVPRPDVPVPLEAAASPRMFAAGSRVAGQGGQSPFSNSGNSRDDSNLTARGQMQLNFAEAEAPSRARSMAGLAEISVDSAASGSQAGEVFSFKLNDRVSIPRQRSAMLPIISGDIEARRVSVSSPGDSGHPTRSVEISNGTDTPLLPGPVGVFDDGVYAGDAQVGHVPPGDTRLLGYATDLEVMVNRREQTDNQVTRLRIVRGVFEQTTAREVVTTFEIENKDERDGRTLIVEQHAWDGWEFDPGVPVTEKAGQIARMEVSVMAGGQRSFKNVASRTDRTTLRLSNFTEQSLLVLSRNGAVKNDVLEAFREWGRKRDAIAQLDSRINALNEESAAISRDQGRIRENMRAVGQNTDLYARYVSNLTTQEDRLDQIRQEIVSTTKQRDQANAQLTEWLSTLNVG